MGELLEVTTTIILTLVFLGGVLFGGSYYLNLLYEEGEKSDRDVLEPQCKQRCTNFDGHYYDLIKDGLQYRCWCLQEDGKGTFLAGELTSPRVGR